MAHPRFSLALQGADALPASGRVLLTGPRAAADLSIFPKDRTVVVQGFYPDHAALARHGWHVVPSIAEAGDGFAAAVVVLPRARGEARARIAGATAKVVAGGPVWIDGQKTDGVDSMIRDIRSRVAISAPLAKAHGKIFRFAAGPEFDDWMATPLCPAPGFTTMPGVFAADRPDRGSELLAAALPGDLSGHVVELGAGWGFLATAILARPDVMSLDLIEADHAALECARANVTDPRAHFHWADATLFKSDGRPATVVTNPPFHVGRAADPALGAAFIAAAAEMLAPQGRLYLVANRHLPYEAVLRANFREVAEIGGDSGFKIFAAARPVAVAPATARPRR
ncbi:Ribosomal RNA small subunit methyltransferase C [Defluviimonas aquaemixtae]|uniref:Ribosomal RNA small subunit methyltransferase C n=1 Tax=Albidovulum aquaemixtae TaxID=1542388 RepID=A0A2R8BNF6_9RHOB|nr:methyltransferase [Defluviimonas aquaemixtae]SPH24863.1 Ribosomal RNA small subunit methyltransferase C [Defluviimonas aquaemixtae]